MNNRRHDRLETGAEAVRFWQFYRYLGAGVEFIGCPDAGRINHELPDKFLCPGVRISHELP